jgi:hypothetical protein
VFGETNSNEEFGRSVVAEEFQTQSTRNTSTLQTVATFLSVTTTTTASTLSAIISDSALLSATQSVEVLSSAEVATETTRIAVTTESYDETAYSYVLSTEAATATNSGEDTYEDTVEVTGTEDDGSGGTITTSGSQNTTITNTFSGSSVTASDSSGYTNLPTYATATVVLLDFSEGGYLTTEESLSAWSAEITACFASQSSRFTVYPSFATFAGQTGQEETGSEQIAQTLTVTTTSFAQVETTLADLSQQTIAPTPTRTLMTQVTVTTSSEEVAYSTSYSGPVDDVTIYAESYAAAQMGSLAWQQSHWITTEAETALPLLTYEPSGGGSFETSAADEFGNGESLTSANFFGRTIEYERSEAAAFAFNGQRFNQNKRAEVAFNSALALVSDNQAGLQISAGGITALRPEGAQTLKSQTMYVNPLGSWSAVRNSSSYTWSADAVGLSETVFNTDGESDSQSGPWQIEGAAPTVALLDSTHVLNAAGRAADGNSLTTWLMPGHYITSDASSSGYAEVASAAVAGVESDAARVARSHRLIALSKGDNAARYFTTSYITSILDPQALVF